VAAVSADRIEYEGVLDVELDRGRCVDLAHFLDGDRDHRQRTAGAAVLLSDLEPHQPHLEELLGERRIDLASFLHLLDTWLDFSSRETGNRLPEELFLFGKNGQRRMAGDCR